MTIRVALHHKTEYRYDRSIHLGPQLVRLRPAYHARTKIEAYSINVSPSDHYCNWQQDPFANPVARYVFEKPTDHLSIPVNVVADMTVINTALAGNDPAWFASTYANGAQAWSAIVASPDKYELAGALNEFFGGYCSTQHTNEVLFGYTTDNNPYADGGC